MQAWINFWSFLFWLSFLGFILNLGNFFKLVLYAEVVWLCIYVYTSVCGGINDDITLISTGFFVLAFAGLEFALGVLLIIIYRGIFKTTNMDEVGGAKNQKKFENKKKHYINRFKWNSKI